MAEPNSRSRRAAAVANLSSESMIASGTPEGKKIIELSEQLEPDGPGAAVSADVSAATADESA